MEGSNNGFIPSSTTYYPETNGDSTFTEDSLREFFSMPNFESSFQQPQPDFEIERTAFEPVSQRQLIHQQNPGFNPQSTQILPSYSQQSTHSQYLRNLDLSRHSSSDS